jgi:predicted transcriptional regulator
VNSDSVKTVRMWVYCAVYDTSVTSLKTVKAFLGRMIEKTRLQRTRYNKDGRHESFRPALLKEMQAISSMSRREARTQLDTIQDLITANIEILLAAKSSEDDSNSLR